MQVSNRSWVKVQCPLLQCWLTAGLAILHTGPLERQRPGARVRLQLVEHGADVAVPGRGAQAYLDQPVVQPHRAVQGDHADLLRALTKPRAVRC